MSVLRPWVFDVTMAGVLLRAAPRPLVPIPVDAWARACGLARDRNRAKAASRAARLGLAS